MDTPGEKNATESPLCEVLKTGKIGGDCRPILLAGISVGVAELPRHGSHRTATPTVQGVSALSAIGVKKRLFFRLRVRSSRYAPLNKGLHRRYGQKKRGFAYILAQTSNTRKPLYYKGFQAVSAKKNGQEF